MAARTDNNRIVEHTADCRLGWREGRGHLLSCAHPFALRLRGPSRACFGRCFSGIAARSAPLITAPAAAAPTAASLSPTTYAKPEASKLGAPATKLERAGRRRRARAGSNQHGSVHRSSPDTPPGRPTQHRSENSLMLSWITGSNDASCDRTMLNHTGAPWEVQYWAKADRMKCSCPPDLWMTANVGGNMERMPAKKCELRLERQKISMTVLSPTLDFPAYTAYEMDKGTYGRDLSKVFNHERTQPSWVDIGANLGILSISLALANPRATGVAYEPNPFTYAFLQHNLRANNLTGRVRAVNAGISSDGRLLHMPHCVIASNTGSQMASTQWRGTRSGQVCFSGACKKKAEGISECMRRNPHMVDVPSVSMTEALAASPTTDLLKVDCEGCEHEVMGSIQTARASGTALRVTGECHAIANMSTPQAAACLLELRGVRCLHGITPYLTCRARPPGATSAIIHKPSSTSRVVVPRLKPLAASMALQ